ncbi:hypothetical protein N9950_02645, partial [Akkermansiaceae bacterium]|nr:hypothetical protein [Akkermansiaceae bacterium]
MKNSEGEEGRGKEPEEGEILKPKPPFHGDEDDHDKEPNLHEHEEQAADIFRDEDTETGRFFREKHPGGTFLHRLW